MFRSHVRLLTPIALAAGTWFVVPASAQTYAEVGGRDHAAEQDAGIPLYETLGDYHREVRTTSPQAQAYFDQGLRLQYAFNHPDAIRSYERAIELDPKCAMCWWGLALAAGPNINSPMDAENGRLAYRAISEASRLAEAGAASEGEAALIEALAFRYDTDPVADRVPLDSAYARAMADVAGEFPDDQDARTLYGASLMNLSPWNYWSGPYGDRTPNEGTVLILETLETALALSPDNPGACHYYIHAVEAAYPEKALPCAERLAALMPGAGHLVHMPGHIYIRVGRYEDAVRANDHAVHGDEVLIGEAGRITLYTGAYYPHNYHFMAFAATMAGMSDKALQASRIVSPKVPFEVARDIYWIQNAVVLPHLTLLTFGRWEQVLDEPMPDAGLVQATVLAHYTRGVAFAALGREAEARDELAYVQAVAEAIEGAEASDPVPAIAAYALAGEIALRTGDAASAVTHFRAAADIEDDLLYDEPPLWYYPIRQSLGRALLEAGDAEGAERVYREDLDRFPANGWSLYGLTLALEAQEKSAEESIVRAQYEDAWRFADVELTASRF